MERQRAAARSSSPPRDSTLDLSLSVSTQGLNDIKGDCSSSSNCLRSRLSHFSHSGSQFQTPRGTEISHLSAFSASRSLTSASRSLTRSLSRTPSGWQPSWGRPDSGNLTAGSSSRLQLERTGGCSAASGRRSRPRSGRAADPFAKHGCNALGGPSGASASSSSRPNPNASGTGRLGVHSRPASGQSKVAIFEDALAPMQEALEFQSLAASSCAASTLAGTSTSTFSNLSASSSGGTAGETAADSGVIPTPTPGSARVGMSGANNSPTQRIVGACSVSPVEAAEPRPRATACRTPRTARSGRSASVGSQEPDIMELLMDRSPAPSEIGQARRRGGSAPLSARRRRRQDDSGPEKPADEKPRRFGAASSSCTTTATTTTASSSKPTGRNRRDSVASSASSSTIVGAATPRRNNLEGLSDSLDVELNRSSRGMAGEKRNRAGDALGGSVVAPSSTLPRRHASAGSLPSSPVAKATFGGAPSPPPVTPSLHRPANATVGGAPSPPPVTPSRSLRHGQETPGSGPIGRSSFSKVGRAICSTPT